MKRCHGFTLVELLVTIAVIGILCGLLLPAVHAARGLAWGVSCRNKLKNITLGYKQYVSVHQMNPGWIQRAYWPPGVRTQDELRYKQQGPSLLAQILPYLDEATVYDAINFSLVGFDGGFGLARDDVKANQTIVGRALGTFLCPADGARQGSSYRGCLGVGPAIHWTREYPDSANGLFASKGITLIYAVTEADVWDGLSHTAAFSEHLVPRINEQDPARTAYAYGTNRGTRTADGVARTCHALAVLPDPPKIAINATWLYTGLHQTLYNHALPPNSTIADCFNAGVIPYFGASAARSNHAGIVNVAFADGSVRAVGDNLSIAVWRALATRDEADAAPGF